MDNQDKTFQYTYSAKEQAEIRKIREKYAPPEEDKMARLRLLDESVTQKATAVSLIVGVIGALVLGSGMSLAMTDIGAVLGLDGFWSMLIGIAVGIIGMVLVGCAYPLYQRIVRRERERIAPEILRLTEELLK